MKTYKFIIIIISFLFSLHTFAQAIDSQLLTAERAFEVSACKPNTNNIVTAWMERRPDRKDNSEDAADMHVAYRASLNNGKLWSEKRIIDLPNTFATGNPFVSNNERGDTYLVCMHIGKNFFSGNISLYEFDFTSEKFNLKSVPVQSDVNLLDKPSIICKGNEIHLVYTAYTKNFKNSVKYQISSDKGKTWSDPISVFKDTTIRYLGPSITILDKGQIAIAAGSYGKKDIYFAKRNSSNENPEFAEPVIVSKVSEKLVSAMTEMSSVGNNVLITWQIHHQRNEAWMSYSEDSGNTWSIPKKVTAYGNLLSATFDNKGNINCIYSDFDNQSFFVGYKLFNKNYDLLKEHYLVEPRSHSTFQEYLGAYQKLLTQGDDFYAFWINYPNNSSLIFSHWKT